MTYVIERNIPLPARAFGKRSKHRLLLAKMAPGDSIVVADRAELTAIYNAGRKGGIPVTARRQEDGTWRMWRVEA
jgi:hypothetical protein